MIIDKKSYKCKDTPDAATLTQVIEGLHPANPCPSRPQRRLLLPPPPPPTARFIMPMILVRVVRCRGFNYILVSFHNCVKGFVVEPALELITTSFLVELYHNEFTTRRVRSSWSPQAH